MYDFATFNYYAIHFSELLQTKFSMTYFYNSVIQTTSSIFTKNMFYSYNKSICLIYASFTATNIKENQSSSW